MRFNHLSIHWCMMSLIMLAVAGGGGVCQAGEKERSLINCDMHKEACTLPLASGSVTLEILPRPIKAMDDLTFRVTAKGLDEKALPSILLNMPAMDMGKNRVALKRDGNGGYEGRGVIVRCRSGKRTWGAKVTFPGVGSTNFIFDVIY